jgi:signal transduction histidine kinase
VNKIVSLEEASKKITDGDYDKKINDELLSIDDEIGHLAYSFEMMRKSINDRDMEITRLLQQKDQFINQLGHDLKHPLNPLINLIPILENSDTDQKNKEIYNVLNRNIQYMKNLVTRTIELAQLNAPSFSLHIENIDLYKEVEYVINKNELLFDEHNITIENKIKDSIFIEADKLLIEELLDNLISNAVKYSPNGGIITVDGELNNNLVIISIKDSGSGMTSDQISQVFNEFYKADPARHDFTSSGLGMSICKRIVEKHGGRIWVESEGPGKGSMFYFTLPIRKIEEK